MRLLFPGIVMLATLTGCASIPYQAWTSAGTNSNVGTGYTISELEEGYAISYEAQGRWHFDDLERHLHRLARETCGEGSAYEIFDVEERVRTFSFSPEISALLNAKLTCG